jgi:hypothetical protein
MYKFGTSDSESLAGSLLDFKDMDENSFDVIIFGTGLVESILAACVLNWLHNWLP